MPLDNCDAFKLVSPAPLPENEPVKVTPVLLFVMTAAGNRASGIVPLDNCDAFKLVSPVPLPLNVPVNVTPLAPLVTTLPGSRASDNVPLTIFDASRSGICAGRSTLPGRKDSATRPSA